MSTDKSSEATVGPSSSTGPEKSRDPVPWKKDFKILGSVSDGGLSFVSLSRQIDAGVGKGYTDHDVIEGVLRAIAPGVKFRSYLEGRKDLTLSILR